jgi:cell division septation protein DedD
MGIAQAQVTVHQGLPPVPPVIPTLNDTPLDQSIDSSKVEKVPALPEFTFEAPRSPLTPPSSPSFSNSNNFSNQYRVEVNATDPMTLAMVKQVEPGAFIKGDRIQAGVFSRQDNAETLRSKLKNNGINANVVAVNGNTTTSTAPIAMGSGVEDRGYFVAIPVSQDRSASVIRKLQQAGVNNALIQERTAPRGRHIAVGPFVSRQEASAVDLQIRGANLDSRVYYAD